MVGGVVSLPDEVCTVLDRYLDLMDRALPQRIEGLYLTGSIPLGDYQPDRSDIDFVAVTASPLQDEERATLKQVHETLQRVVPEPAFDGIYCTWSDLCSNPTGCYDVPYSLQGVFHSTGGFEANPATWLLVHRYPLAICGPAAPPVWHEAETIRHWNRENLNTYWQGFRRKAGSPVNRARALSNRRVVDALQEWCVPGVVRLHYTITTGDITSKSGACRYALATFPPRWHPVVREALALRTGDRLEARQRWLRYRDVLAFVDVVIHDAMTLV